MPTVSRSCCVYGHTFTHVGHDWALPLPSVTLHLSACEMLWSAMRVATLQALPVWPAFLPFPNSLTSAHISAPAAGPGSFPHTFTGLLVESVGSAASVLQTLLRSSHPCHLWAPRSWCQYSYLHSFLPPWTHFLFPTQFSLARSITTTWDFTALSPSHL